MQSMWYYWTVILNNKKERKILGILFYFAIGSDEIFLKSYISIKLCESEKEEEEEEERC